MARHGRGRKGRNMSRYLKGMIDEELSIGTLAGRTMVKVDFDETVNDRTLVSSIVATYVWSDPTPGEDIGPLMVGIAHSDYLFGEIEQVIENTGSWDEGNLPSQEIAKRKVRIIGIFETTIAVGAAFALNNGKPIKSKLNWILSAGDTLSVWAYNLGANAFATTVPEVHVQGHANLFPT